MDRSIIGHTIEYNRMQISTAINIIFKINTKSRTVFYVQCRIANILLFTCMFSIIIL